MINFNGALSPVKNRIFGFKFGDFFIEICRVLKKFAYNDIDNALIIYVVANAAMQDVVESGLHTKEMSDSELMGLLSVRGVNISNVSNTTGIDRATARRKLKKLEGLGFLLRKDDGTFIIKPGFTSNNSDVETLVEAQWVALRKLIKDLIKYGVITE